MNKLVEKLLKQYIADLEKVKPDTEKYGEVLWEIKRAKEELEKMSTPASVITLSQTGGDWLGAARNWIQCKFRNGESVTWGSQDVLEGKLVTVRDIESLAATIAAAAINEYKKG